jgi:hypothetical protein
MLCLLFGGLAAFGLFRIAHRMRRGAWGGAPWSHRCHHGHHHHHHGRWHGLDDDEDRGGFGFGGFESSGGFGRGFDDEGRGGRGSRRGGRVPFILRGIFERLETTPGQERVILEALDELKDQAKKARAESKATISDVASALRGEELGTEQMGSAFAHVDSAVEGTRDALFAALSKIHAALEPAQRKILADMLERRGFRFGF